MFGHKKHVISCGIVRTEDSVSRNKHENSNITFLDIWVGQSFQDILVELGVPKCDAKHNPFAEAKDLPGHPGQ
jgi:hypothetical protein